MGELSQVSIVVAASLGLLYFLVKAAPSIREFFAPTGKPAEERKRTSDRPDICAPCREKVDHVEIGLVEFRKESQHRDENLCNVMGQMRDALLQYLAEERALRNTGTGIPIHTQARGGGGGSRL